MSQKGPEVGVGMLDFVEDILWVLNRIKSPSLSIPFVVPQNILLLGDLSDYPLHLELKL